MPAESAKPVREDGQENKITAERLEEQAASAGESLKEQAADLAHRGVEKIDEGLKTAADAMQHAAAAIDERAQYLPDGPSARKIAYRAADTLETGADYLRTHDTESMLRALVRAVRKHPGASLAAATVAGFLVGCALRRD